VKPVVEIRITCICPGGATVSFAPPGRFSIFRLFPRAEARGYIPALLRSEEGIGIANPKRMDRSLFHAQTPESCARTTAFTRRLQDLHAARNKNAAPVAVQGLVR
jgi:hypothetical protein